MTKKNETPTNTENPAEEMPQAEKEIEIDGHTDEVEIESKIRKLEDDVQGLKDENLRLISDMRNESQRNREYTERQVKNANQNLLQELVPVLDAIDAGLAHSQEAEHVLYKGLEMTQTTLLGILTKSGVSIINPEAGSEFDPDKHEAMGMTPSAEHPDHSVLTVLQKGYMLNDRVIRAAKVMIATAP